jgi:hypothetical protein
MHQKRCGELKTNLGKKQQLLAAKNTSTIYVKKIYPVVLVA